MTVGICLLLLNCKSSGWSWPLVFIICVDIIKTKNNFIKTLKFKNVFVKDMFSLLVNKSGANSEDYFCLCTGLSRGLKVKYPANGRIHSGDFFVSFSTYTLKSSPQERGASKKTFIEGKTQNGCNKLKVDKAHGSSKNTGLKNPSFTFYEVNQPWVISRQGGKPNMNAFPIPPKTPALARLCKSIAI